MKIYISLSLLLSLTLSYGASEYQVKVCKEIPYLITIKKAALKLRHRSLWLIDKKYSASKDFKLKEKESLKVDTAISMSVCEDEDTLEGVTIFMKDKVQYIVKAGKMCLKEDNNVVSKKVKNLFELTDSRDQFINHSWQSYYKSAINMVCLNFIDSKNCKDKSAPKFNYISMKELKVKKDLCQTIVKDANVFLNWKNSLN